MTVETAAVLPQLPPPDSIEWTLSEIVGLFVPAYGAASLQRVRYGNARRRATVRYTNLSLDQRNALAAFVDRVGTHRPFWLVDSANDKQGSFPATELITAPHLAATWSDGTSRSHVADVLGVKVASTAGAGSSYVALAATVSVTANSPYCFRAHFEQGAGSATVTLCAGSTPNGTTYGQTSSATAAGRISLKCAPTASTMYVSISDSLSAGSNGWGATPTYHFMWPSIVRCFEVDGGTSPTVQYGNDVYVKSLPTSTNGTLAAGDVVEFISSAGSQMVKLTRDVHSDSSGKARLYFEPTLRFGVSNGDMVVPLKPQAMVVLSEDPLVLTRPGRYWSDVDLKVEEIWP